MRLKRKARSSKWELRESFPKEMTFSCVIKDEWALTKAQFGGRQAETIQAEKSLKQ